MAIVKTLLLQVFFLLTLLGATQAKANNVELTPKTTPCGYPLNFTCTDTGSGGDTVTHVQFYKDGQADGAWLDVSVTAQLVVSAFLDVTNWGKYTCKGAIDSSGTEPSDASNTVEVACDECDNSPQGRAACAAVDPESTCCSHCLPGSEYCICIRRGTKNKFPNCPECTVKDQKTDCNVTGKTKCSTDTGKCVECNQAAKTTVDGIIVYDGCNRTTPYCDPTTFTCGATPPTTIPVTNTGSSRNPNTSGGTTGSRTTTTSSAQTDLGRPAVVLTVMCSVLSLTITISG